MCDLKNGEINSYSLTWNCFLCVMVSLFSHNSQQLPKKKNFPSKYPCFLMFNTSSESLNLRRRKRHNECTNFMVLRLRVLDRMKFCMTESAETSAVQMSGCHTSNGTLNFTREPAKRLDDTNAAQFIHVYVYRECACVCV